MKKLMKSVLACLLAFAMVLTVMPVNSYAAAKKSVVVTNQKQLEKALKNGAANIVKKVTQELMNSKCPMSDSLDEKQYSVAFYTK